MKYPILSYGLAGLLSLATLPVSADTLQEIYLLALKNDPQLKAERAAYAAEQENVAIARSRLLPQIGGTAQYNDSSDDESYQGGVFIDPETNTIFPRGQEGTSETDSTTYSITLTQPLFDLPAWFEYKRGQARSEQAEAQFGADQQALIVRVSTAYFDVLRAIDNLETSIAEEKALGQRLEQTKQRFEVGLTAITDVHEAQAAFDNATAATLAARGNLGIAFEALEVLTGTTHEEIAPLQEKFPVVKPDPVDRHEWVEFALKNNFSLRAAKLAAEASHQNARASKAAHLPTLTGSLRHTSTDSDGSDVNDVSFDSERDTNTISIQLDVPIYSGGGISGQRRQAYQQYMQTHELYNKAQRDTIQNARSLHLQVVTDVAQVKARAQAITSSLSALEATQAGYDVGTRNLVDVLDAQRTVYQARRNYSDALYNYVINSMRLKEVAGILSPEDIEELDKWLNAAKSISRAKYSKM